MGEKIEVHLVTLVIVDHDQMGIEEVKDVLHNTRYPNHCFPGMFVHKTETREVNWTDDHPLNFQDKQHAAANTMFRPKPKLRTCEKCGGPGPCLWDDPSGGRYLCRCCHSNPDDEFFVSHAEAYEQGQNDGYHSTYLERERKGEL